MFTPSSTSHRKSAQSGLGKSRDQNLDHNRSGSGSSHEPLLPSRSNTSNRHYTRGDSLPVPKSAIPSKSAPRVPVTPSKTHYRSNTLDTRLASRTTPRSSPPTATQTPHRDKGQYIHRAVSPSASGGVKLNTDVPASAGLHSPQPRAPITFLPQAVPRLHHIPPTPQKNGKGRVDRVDSFLSDSLPVPQPLDSAQLSPPQQDYTIMTRHPAFVTPNSPSAVPIQRSKSAPGIQSKGRISPCLRIPSPKFLSKGKTKEARKVTPESVGSPILRDTRSLPKEKSTMAKITQRVRRTAHGSFDFERPGSRGSSKSGQSEPKSSKSEDVREKMEQIQIQDTAARARSPVFKKDSTRGDVLKVKKATSPVPPLPTSRIPSRYGATSSPSPPRGCSPPSYAAVPPSSSHDDDSVLPRLSSSLGRRSISKIGSKTHSTHPSFAFERSGVLQDVRRDRSGSTSLPKPASHRSKNQYVDTHTGLMWTRTNLKENKIAEDDARLHSSRAPEVTRISSRALEEATAVIAELKDVLTDSGFSRLQICQSFAYSVSKFDSLVLQMSLGLTLRLFPSKAHRDLSFASRDSWTVARLPLTSVKSDNYCVHSYGLSVTAVDSL